MNCISCKKSSFGLYSQKSYLNLPVYKCKNCDLFITGNSEKQLESTLQNYYKKTVPIEEVRKTIELDHETNHGRYLKNLWNSHYFYCKPFFQKSKDLLEIGPGTGLALRLFEENGFNVIGIESNENYVTFINQKLKNGHCISGLAENIDLDQKFDVIWLSHCFEHMVRPHILLEKCKSLLKDNGFIFIAVPDCENEDILKKSIFDNASSFHFTKNSLQKIAKNSGLKVERCDSVRELVRIEGRIEMTLQKYLKFISRETCPYYPFKKTHQKNGIEIRMILKNL